MTAAEQKAREMISNLTLAELLDEWELTSKIDNPEIYTVRGWLMDEIESRNPEAFDKLWYIWGINLERLEIKANSFDEAIEEARKINKNYCIGQLKE